MTSIPVEPVKQFWLSKGLSPCTAYYGQTGFIVGEQVETAHWRLTYAVEAGSFVIKGFQLFKQNRGLSSATRSLLLILQELVASVPDISEVRGILLAHGSEAEQSSRIKMAKIFLKAGARVEQDPDFGDIVLVKRTDKKRAQG